MSRMAFHILGVGYRGFSGGSAILAFKCGGAKFLYSAACQGTSSSKVYSTDHFEIKNSVDEAEEQLLGGLNGMIANIEIPDAFLICGTVNFSLKIEDQDSGKILYEIQRNPDVRGGSAGDIKITTRLHINHLENGYEEIWWKVWNGELLHV